MNWGNVRIDQTKEQGGELRKRSVKELLPIMGGAYKDLSVQVAYKEGYNKAIELTSLIDRPKVDTGEKVFTKEWVDSHEGGYVAISAIEKYAKQLLKNRGYVKAEITQTPTQPRTTSTDIEELKKIYDRSKVVILTDTNGRGRYCYIDVDGDIEKRMPLFDFFAPHLSNKSELKKEAVGEIEDGLYEYINSYGDLLFDVLEESKKYGYDKQVIRENQDKYNVFRETKTRIRAYFKTLQGHIPSIKEYLSSNEKEVSR